MSSTSSLQALFLSATGRAAFALMAAAGFLLLAPAPAEAAVPATAQAPASAPEPAADDATPKAEEAGMWIGTAAVICLEQDPSLATTPFGRQLTGSPSYTAWHKEQRPAVLSCFAGAHLLSPALCKDIFGQDPNQASEDRNRALFDKHSSTIAHLAHMDDCVSR